MRSKYLHLSDVVSGVTYTTTTAMLFFALSSCSPKGKDELQQYIDSLNVSSQLDSIKTFKEIEKENQYRKKDKAWRDSISKKDTEDKHNDWVEKNRKVSDLRFPTFKDPKIAQVEKHEYIENGTIISLTDLIGKLQKETSTGKIFLLEGSPEHLLFKDSLLLFSVFSDKNSLGSQVNINMEKNKFTHGTPPLDKTEEKKLYNYFLAYIEARLNGKKQKRESDIRNTVIKKEERGGVTLYYTDIDKREPGVFAQHPSIQPKGYGYIWRIFAPYETADIYKLDYKQPSQNITTISQEIFSDYGIYTPKDISYILRTINAGTPFSQDSIFVDKQKTDEQKTIDTLKYTQYYTIKKNGETLLQIQDYSTPDNDQVKINGQGYTISNTPINIDLSTLAGNKVIVEIINEGDIPPNTLLLKLGTYKKKLEGKKGEIIVLEFEE